MFWMFFSPLAANIYFPAIPLLADDFAVSVSLMNLTVTVYLIFQGLCEFVAPSYGGRDDSDASRPRPAPMLWGPLADLKGRRPTYLGG